MGTWGTAIKDNDDFDDIYSEFFDLYNNGGDPNNISQKILAENLEILEIEEERHNFWFALALAQWETKSLDPNVLSTVEEIIVSGNDLELWLEFQASELDIKKRKVVLDKFLEKLKSERIKAKPRKRKKLKTPIFLTGDCFVFKMKNGNYGGALVIATDENPETAYNLIATTRLNESSKPTLSDFENADVLICNFAQYKDEPKINWYMPDHFHKDYSDIYELIGNISVEVDYDSKNYQGKGYLFKPSYTSGWNMNNAIERQLDSEFIKPKPSKKLSIKQLIKKNKWWKIF